MAEGRVLPAAFESVGAKWWTPVLQILVEATHYSTASLGARILSGDALGFSTKRCVESLIF